MITTFPHKFVWRQHQKEPWNMFVNNEIKNMFLVWHRRAGKTKMAVNIFCVEGMRRVGLYLFLFPTREQAKDIVWEGRGSDGVRFLDHFPPELVAKTNNADLSITLINGSIIKLRGSAGKSFDNKRGGNPFGVIYDEFAYMDPRAQKPLSLVLAENNGWEIMITTPKGHNHAYDFFHVVKNDPDWYTSILTIDDTKDENNQPIFTLEKVESLKKINGQEWVDQELYCSFEVSNVGAIFGGYIDAAYKENRVRNYLIDTSLPVYTFWDLGWTDSTCIWLVQFSPDINHIDEIRCVDYYEAHNQEVVHFANWLRDWRDRNGIVFAQHWFPHDGDAAKVDGITYQSLAKKAGMKVECIPSAVSRKDIAINLTKNIMPRIVFNETKCERGLECLKNYRRIFDSDKQSYGLPVHDWASHGSDALMTLAEFLNLYRKPVQMKIRSNSIYDKYY